MFGERLVHADLADIAKCRRRKDKAVHLAYIAPVTLFVVVIDLNL